MSREGKPTDVTDGLGGPVLARIERGASSTARDADGRALLQFVSRGPEAKTADLFRIEVRTPDGAPVATMDVVRRSSGWSLARTLDAAVLGTLF